MEWNEENGLKRMCYGPKGLTTSKRQHGLVKKWFSLREHIQRGQYPNGRVTQSHACSPEKLDLCNVANPSINFSSSRSHLSNSSTGPRSTSIRKNLPVTLKPLHYPQSSPSAPYLLTVLHTGASTRRPGFSPTVHHRTAHSLVSISVHVTPPPYLFGHPLLSFHYFDIVV